MIETYWWALPLWWASGAFCAYLVATVRRPDRVECPDCDTSVRSREFRAHWKKCLS
jgi:hypothetical protein